MNIKAIASVAYVHRCIGSIGNALADVVVSDLQQALRPAGGWVP